MFIFAKDDNYIIKQIITYVTLVASYVKYKSSNIIIFRQNTVCTRTNIISSFNSKNHAWSYVFWFLFKSTNKTSYSMECVYKSLLYTHYGSLSKLWSIHILVYIDTNANIKGSVYRLAAISITAKNRIFGLYPKRESTGSWHYNLQKLPKKKVFILISKHDFVQLQKN